MWGALIPKGGKRLFFSIYPALKTTILIRNNSLTSEEFKANTVCEYLTYRMRDQHLNWVWYSTYLHGFDRNLNFNDPCFKYSLFIVVLHMRYLQTVFFLYSQEVRLSFLIKMCEAGEMKGAFLSLLRTKTMQNSAFVPFPKYPSCFSLQGHIFLYDTAKIFKKL